MCHLFFKYSRGFYYPSIIAWQKLWNRPLHPKFAIVFLISAALKGPHVTPYSHRSCSALGSRGRKSFGTRNFRKFRFAKFPKFGKGIFFWKAMNWHSESSSSTRAFWIQQKSQALLHRPHGWWGGCFSTRGRDRDGAPRPGCWHWGGVENLSAGFKDCLFSPFPHDVVIIS